MNNMQVFHFYYRTLKGKRSKREEGSTLRIALAGGTGFVGTALTNHLTNNGHELFILTRHPEYYENDRHISYIKWLEEGSRPENHLQDIDAVINLAGESINSGRWTAKRKQSILDSRIRSTRTILDLMLRLDKRPNVLINASAIGFYGVSEVATFTEKEEQSGADFLAQTTASWEREALKAKEFNIRTAMMRFGVILGTDDGALPRMVLPYRFGIGGKIGSGRQWLSWVHIEDVVRSIAFTLLNEKMEGPVNVTAPNPKQMDTFGKTIGNTLHKPHWLPVPGFAMKVMLGDMSMLVLKGQKVLPEKLLEHGFTFRYPELEDALGNLLKNPS